MLFSFQVFYTEMRNGRPLGTASLMEVPLSLDMLTTVSIQRVLIMLLYGNFKNGQPVYNLKYILSDQKWTAKTHCSSHLRTCISEVSSRPLLFRFCYRCVTSTNIQHTDCQCTCQRHIHHTQKQLFSCNALVGDALRYI